MSGRGERRRPRKRPVAWECAVIRNQYGKRAGGRCLRRLPRNGQCALWTLSMANSFNGCVDDGGLRTVVKLDFKSFSAAKSLWLRFHSRTEDWAVVNGTGDASEKERERRRIPGRGGGPGSERRLGELLIIYNFATAALAHASTRSARQERSRTSCGIPSSERYRLRTRNRSKSVSNL